MQAYKLGLVSVSFRQHTPEVILKATKNAGLSYIEWGSDVHAPADDLCRLEEIVRLQRRYGITCSAYGTGKCTGSQENQAHGYHVFITDALCAYSDFFIKF